MLRRFVIATVSLVLPAGTVAQSYPANPAHRIVPYQVGAASDLVARGIGQMPSQKLGQPFVVENRIAANGMVGLEYLARAEREVVRRLNTEVNGMLLAPGFKAKVLAASMIEATVETPEKFGAFLRTDRQRFAKMAKQAVIRMN